MLLSLPKMQYAGVNSLLLHVNKQALFIHHSVSKITGAGKLFFLSSLNFIFRFLQNLFRMQARGVYCNGDMSFHYPAAACIAITEYTEQRPFFSPGQKNKRRGMV
jgi:hypothetical protein